MFTQKIKKISLIIQVYQGGLFLKDCLDSVRQNIYSFNSIYISINKSACSNADLHTALSLKKEIKKILQDNINITIFTQDTRLSARDHSIVFYKNILQCDKTADFFMILCHDDILLPAFSANISSILSNLNENEILNPARSYYKENFTKKTYKGSCYGLLSYPDFKTTKEEFAMRSLDCAPSTCITGFILSKKALFEYLKILPFFAYGYRAEYVMMFLPSVKYVKSTNIPIVGIRNHTNQTGAQYFAKAHIHDERLYFFLLWYISKNANFKSQIKKHISFFSKDIFIFFDILKLHFRCFLFTKSISTFLEAHITVIITIFQRILTKVKKISKSFK